MQKPRLLPALVTCIIVGIILPAIVLAAFQKGNAKTNDYLRNGKLTDCTILSILQVGSASSVQVTYTDENGNPVTASATLNRSPKAYHVGQHIQAYVLPGRPAEAFIPASGALKAVVFFIIAVFILIGWSLPVFYLISMRRYNRLMKDGSFAEGTLIDIEVIRNVMFSGTLYMGLFRFQTNSGNTVTEQLQVNKNARVGETYQLMYYEMPNGKCICDVADYRLNG